MTITIRRLLSLTWLLTRLLVMLLVIYIHTYIRNYIQLSRSYLAVDEAAGDVDPVGSDSDRASLQAQLVNT